MRLILFTGLLLLYTAVIQAQQPDIVFHHLKERDGLSHNFVVSFLRDSRGILWLGTQNGLDRFDGEHFYSFMRSRNPNTIIDNGIVDLCEDKKGYIWGATGNGVFRYSVADNTFKNYKTPSTRFAKVIQNIICDRNGTIWATGEWNIMCFDPVKDAFIDFKPINKSPDSLREYSVRRNGMLVDPAGRGMWFATRTGIHFYEHKTGQYLNYKNQPVKGLFNNHSYCAMTESASGVFWAFDNTEKAIISFDPIKMEIKEKISLLPFMKEAFGVSLFEDSEGRLWFSSWEHGVLLIDRKKGNKIQRLTHNDADDLSIAGDFLWETIQDADGTIWCGTTGGLSRCNPSKSVFKLYQFADLDSTLGKETITILVEDPADSSWWMSLKSSRVLHYYPRSHRLETLDLKLSQKNSRGQVPGGLNKIKLYKDTVFFCATNGTWILTTGHGKVSPYVPDISLVPDFTILDVIPKTDSIFFLSNFYSLLKWNRTKGSIVQIKASVDTLQNGQLPVFNYPAISSNGTLWFAAGFGWIGYLDQANKPNYIKMQTNPQLDYNGYYSSLAFDNQGHLWLANRGAGLDRYDPVARRSSSYYQSDGLVSDEITNAIPDRKGILWCSVNNRFSVFDPVSSFFYNFKLPVSEGFSSYDNYSILNTAGHILTTVNNRIVEFIPDRLSYQPVSPIPEISAVRINGVDSLLNQTQLLKLEPEENSLVFKFGMLTDRDVFPYDFRYQLIGIDDSMKLASAAEAVYNNLPPGRYTFKVVAVSKSRSWRSAETTIEIVIRTPFFKAKWFFALLFLLSFGSVFLLYRYRIRQKERLLQLESKAQLLEKEKALVMYENLKQHLNPHFLFNSLTSLSSLIRLDGKMAGDFLDKMSKVYRYVLKNRDNEVVPLGEEIKFVQLYNDLQLTRFEKSLRINMNIDVEYYHRKIAPVTLQNLVENAIKHNTADPESPLVIDLYVEEDYLVVRNNLQRKNFVETSNKQGLQNMISLYDYLSDRKMQIEESAQFFTVKIPLL